MHINTFPLTVKKMLKIYVETLSVCYREKVKPTGCRCQLILSSVCIAEEKVIHSNRTDIGN